MLERYLIFGGTGSLGKKLIERLLPVAEVGIYSRDESKHWSIKNELANDKFLPRLRTFVGDVRSTERMKQIIRQYKPATLILAAALKHVDTCELSPSESTLTNVVGTQNVVDILQTTDCNSIKNVMFVSTDKACAPVSVYGMCKALSERIITSQAALGNPNIKYVAVRYGNVLESRGSIIPLFKYQAENSECITVTNPDMTRFVMTLDESVDLILETLQHGNSGEIWIPKLPAMRIGDLAEIFSEKSGKPISVIGFRPGEKMHEELINSTESVRTDMNGACTRYIMKPSFMPVSRKAFTYGSKDTVFTKDQLLEYLEKLGILDAPLESFKGSSIEHILTNQTK